MAHTIWGGAPRNDCDCSRNGAPRGGSSGTSARVVVLTLVACLGLAAVYGVAGSWLAVRLIDSARTHATLALS